MGNLKNSKGLALAVLTVLLVLGVYKFFTTYQQLVSLRSEFASTTADLETAQNQIQTLTEDLNTEKYKNDLFSGQIKEIASTVGTLDKLSKTDKELLQKYSKVYFLNENYVPENLATITPEFVFEKDRVQKFHTKAWPFLEHLLQDASASGNRLEIISGFRSFNEQGSLKGSYIVTYGSGANKFSADQGYSEHQLGTAVDLTTSTSGAGFNGFSKTAGYKWLLDNAYKYGFVLSYPEKNNYYQFEPWHWRFVGTQLARRLHEDNVYFYDLDQRTIDAYLIHIFD